MFICYILHSNFAVLNANVKFSFLLFGSNLLKSKEAKKKIKYEFLLTASITSLTANNSYTWISTVNQLKMKFF